MADSFPLIGNRQYYKSGAYENPVTAIDTQSGQIFRDAIDTLSAQTVKVIEDKKAQMTEDQKRAQELMDWTMKYNLNEKGKVMDAMAKSGNNNPQLIDVAFKEVDAMAAIMGKAKGASTPEEQRMYLTEGAGFQKRLAALQGHIGQMNDSLKIWDEDSIGPLNTQGSINLNNPRALMWSKQMAITRGQNPGSMSWFVDDDGDWAVRHEGPMLDKPTETKAGVFFSFEPGIIPESDKQANEALVQTFGEKYREEMPDQFLMGQTEIGPNGEEVMVPSVEYIPTGTPGMIQPVYRTNMQMAANLWKPHASSIALGYAQDMSSAEAFWDGLGKDKKNRVIKSLAQGKNPINVPFDDLQVGTGMVNGVPIKISENSALAIIRAMEFEGERFIPKFRLAGNAIKDPNAQKRNGRSGAGSGKGSKSITVEELNELVNQPIKDQVEHVQGLLTPGEQEIEWDPKNPNIVTVVDFTGDEQGEKTVYYLDTKTGEGIPGATGDRVGGRKQWEDRFIELYTGNTAADRKLERDWRMQRNKTRDAKTGKMEDTMMYTGESLSAAELIKKYSNQ